MSFIQGYALVIGVSTYFKTDSLEQLPVAEQDARAVAAVLADPQGCGYLPEQVTLLIGPQATAEAIRGALAQLVERKPHDALFIYYSGHGKFDARGHYYFTTSDTCTEGDKIASGSGIVEKELLTALREIKSRQIVLLLNSCFAGAVTSGNLASGISHDHPIPPSVLHAALDTGIGRALITACGQDQESYYWRDEPTSLFAQAVVDGLRGRRVQPQGDYIVLSDLYRSIYWQVTEMARKRGHKQTPELTISRSIGEMPVAFYRRRLGEKIPASRPVLQEVSEGTVHKVPRQVSQAAYLQLMAPAALRLRRPHITIEELLSAFRQLAGLERPGQAPIFGELGELYTTLKRADERSSYSREGERIALAEARELAEKLASQYPWLNLLIPALERLKRAAGG